MTYLVAIFLALLATAFFSAAEMAFIAANRVRMRHLAESGTARRRATSSRSGGPNGSCRRP
jgi:CBS domain containing-hemolysin-like protein